MTAPKTPRIGSEKTSRKLARNTMQLDSHRQEIVFWDLNNPKSVVNLISEKIRKHAMEIPPELLVMSADTIKSQHKLGFTDEQLRIAFWDEFFLTIDGDYKEMRSAAIYSRICTKEMFFNIVENPIRLAYMMHPPEDYILQMRSLLNMGLERYKEFLKLPVIKPNGQVDTKLVAEITKIVALIDNRVKGAVTQKIQVEGTQKNLHVHAHASNAYEPPKSYTEIGHELKEVEREIERLKDPNFIPKDYENEQETIDVEGTEVTRT